VIQNVPLPFAKEFEVQDFQAPSGWLDSCKKRNSISQNSLTGESNEMSQDVVNSFNEKIS
jgi:hypothetical protein